MSDFPQKTNVVPTSSLYPPITAEKWHKQGESLFGPDEMKWRFVCPACGHVASVQDYKDAAAPQGAVGFSCIGRFLPDPREAFGSGPGPCNYAGGGLIRLNPVDVDGHRMFAFADGVA